MRSRPVHHETETENVVSIPRWSPDLNIPGSDAACGYQSIFDKLRKQNGRGRFFFRDAVYADRRITDRSFVCCDISCVAAAVSVCVINCLLRCVKLVVSP